MTSSSEDKTRRPAPSPTETEAPNAPEALFVFRVGAAWLAVPAGSVDEICANAAPFPVPRAPRHIPGVINLRGRALPLLDVAQFLALDRGARPGGVERTELDVRIAVVSAGGMRVGIVCDQVRGVAEVPRADLKEIELTQGDALRRFARAEVRSTERLTALLDVEALLEATRVRR